MPIHDWTRVTAGTWHDFHQDWTIEIRRRLNGGILPPGYQAMTDQRVKGWEPDVIALQPRDAAPAVGGTAVATAPRLRQVGRASLEAAAYARRANRIVVQVELGRVVAVIEVVSPGNKDSTHAVRAFAAKAVDLLRDGINLLVVDLFPPTPRDPQGIHQVIWDGVVGEPFEARPADKPLTVASYDAAGDALTAHVEPLAVGDRLPDAPLFLAPDLCVACPLEAAYQTSWGVAPVGIRKLVDPAA